MKYIHRILLVGSSILIIYCITLFLSFGPLSFLGITFLLSLVGFFYGLAQYLKKDQLLNQAPHYLRILISGILTLSMLCFIFLEGFLIYQGQQTNDQPVDKVIVLGAGLNGDQISTSLRYRLEATIEYYQTSPDTIIIVSGGQGEGELITEAKAMKDYLLSNGIPEDKIIEEDQSTNTYENFRYSSQYLNPTDTVMIITNDFHMARAKLIASSLGIQAYGYPAQSHLMTLPLFYIREFFAYIKDFILIRLPF